MQSCARGAIQQAADTAPSKSCTVRHAVTTSTSTSSGRGRTGMTGWTGKGWRGTSASSTDRVVCGLLARRLSGRPTAPITLVTSPRTGEHTWHTWDTGEIRAHLRHRWEWDIPETQVRIRYTWIENKIVHKQWECWHTGKSAWLWDW